MSERAKRASGGGTDRLTSVVGTDRFGSRRGADRNTARTTRTLKTDTSAEVGCHRPGCLASGMSPLPVPLCNRSHPLRTRRHG